MRDDVDQPKESLAHEAHRRLEEMIVTLELLPGSKWSEEAFVKSLGIGRTPVREAVLKLQNDSLIEVLPRHGIVISQIDIHKQMLALEFRREIERFVSTRAARRATKRQRTELENAAAQMETAGTHEIREYLSQVFDLNLMIVVFSGNPFARKAISPLHALSRRFYFRYHEEINNLNLSGRLHAIRARAIVSGSEKDSLEASDALMSFIEDYTKKIFINSIYGG